jgi:hypothetical protein
MHLIDNGTQVASVPTPQPAVGTPGYAAGGVPGSFAATVFDPDMGNSLILELVNVILAAGISLDRTNNTQLLAAIRYFRDSQHGAQGFATAGAATFTPPAGVFKVWVEAWGAGGGSGGVVNGASSGGGAGGTYGFGWCPVTPGVGVTVTVGAGGTAGTSGGGNGTPGGTSSFGSLITAPGGLGSVGNNSAGTTVLGGASGATPAGSANSGGLIGARGAGNGYIGGVPVAGAGSGAPLIGTGGYSGFDGSMPGAGAGGTAGVGSSSAGHDAADGYVRVLW